MGMKGPMPNYNTVDDYIANQSIEAQILLKELRNLIIEAAPNATELINYKIPSFTLVPNGKKEQQIMIAAYAKFVSFYPFPSTLEKFSNELKDYKLGKGTVQFPYNEPLPTDLIVEMVRYRREEILKDWK